MRTIKYLKNVEKKKKISNETLEIFAPLADRIGIRKIKDELEDLAFEELNPNVKKTIVKRMNFLKSEGKNNIRLIKDNSIYVSKDQLISLWKSGIEKIRSGTFDSKGNLIDENGIIYILQTFLTFRFAVFSILLIVFLIGIIITFFSGP